MLPKLSSSCKFLQKIFRGLLLKGPVAGPEGGEKGGASYAPASSLLRTTLGKCRSAGRGDGGPPPSYLTEHHQSTVGD